MSKLLPRPARRACLTRREERGNFVVTTALLIVVLIGVIALVVDVGFAAGQRRFMQNGADAAVLAAARLLSESVTKYQGNAGPSGFPIRFVVKDADVYKEAYDIAKENRNAALNGRSTFEVSVDYCVAADPASYAPDVPGCGPPDDPSHPDNHWVASAGNQTNDPNNVDPTATVPDGTYKVRVTVSSTVSTLFGGVIGKNGTPTNGRSVAVILGVCDQTTVTGDIWPFTLWDQQDFGTDPGQLFELWGPNAPRPGPNGAWKNMLDLTPANRWCDGNPPDYKWQFPAMIPNEDQGDQVNCADPSAPTDPTKNFAGADPTWYRDGYAEDKRGGCYVGNDEIYPDVTIWAATTYQGTLRVHNYETDTPGNKVPTFQDEQPAQSGDQGNNVAEGIWGGTSLPCVGTDYFFQDQNISGIDEFGRYRDVVVLTWDNPEYWQSNSNTWSSTGNTPDRVELMRVLHFRIYMKYGNSNNASIYGRVVSPDYRDNYNPPDCPDFGHMGPSIYGNVVRLGA